MTTQVFSSEKSRKISRYFSFQWKQAWPALVCLIIVFLLSFVLPAVFVNTSLNKYYEDQSKGESYVETVEELDADIKETLIEYLNIDGMVNVFISILAALYIGMNSMKFVNSKVAVNFYHSLPIKRERHYITAAVIGLSNFIIAYLPASLLAALIINLNGNVTVGMPALTISLKYFAYSLIFFIFIYGIQMLAGMFSGTGFAKSLVGLMLLFLPLCLYMTIIFMMSENNVYSNLDYYYSYDILKIICPILRLGEVYTTGKLTLESVLIMLSLGIILTVIGLIIYRKRKSETATIPIYCVPVAAIIKYSAMFIVTYITGIVFKSIVDSVLWEIIGFAIGMILSFMISNMILYKSSKAMFRNAYKMAYFSLVFVIVFVIFGGNIFKLDTKVPPASLTTSIKVDVLGVEVEYCDKDDVDQITKLSKDIINNKNQYGQSSDVEKHFDYDNVRYYYWKNENIYIGDIVVTGYGYFVVPNSKVFRNIDDKDALYNYILSTPEYETAVNSKEKGEKIEDLRFCFNNFFDNIYLREYYENMPENIKKIINERINDVKGNGIEIGYVDVYYANNDKNGDVLYEQINIYSGDYELVNYYMDETYKNQEELHAFIISKIKYVFINNETTGEVYKITDSRQIENILLSSVIGGNYANQNEVEKNIVAFIVYNSDSRIDIEVNETHSYNFGGHDIIYFYKGMIPDYN